MSMIEVQLKTWGNSYGFIIPKEIIKENNFHPGQTIKIDLIGNKRVDAFGTLPGLGEFVREDLVRDMQ